MSAHRRADPRCVLPTQADQAPLLPDLSAVAAAKHRADAECLTAPEPVEAADAMEAEQVGNCFVTKGGQHL